MKKKLLLLFLLCLTSACGYEEVSVPTTTNIILESYVDGDAFIEYDINILSTLSVSSNENYILAKVINRSINESNIVLFVQNKRATFDQFVLDGTLNMPGVGHIDLGLSNDGSVEVPLRVADGLRLYRYSDNSGIDYFKVPGGWTGGVVNNGFIALLSSKGQVSYAKSNMLFSNKGSNGDQGFRKLDIGVASSLQDIVSHGDHLGLLVQGKRRSTFWYYLIDPESSQVISKHLIEGLDFLTELRVVSVNNSDEVVIAESRKSVPLKKIKLGFVRLNVKTGDVAYQAYSSKNDDEIAVSLSCRPNQKSVPISVYSNGNDAGDSLFIDAGESRQNKLDLPGKKYIQDLAMLDREGDQASAVLVYDSIRDYMAIQTLAVVHVSDFIDCNN